MQALTRIFFEVNARDANFLLLGAGLDSDKAMLGQRLVILRNLVTLGQIRIEVVLAREDRKRLNVAAERERRLDRVIDRGAVEDRQRARHAEAHGAHVRVRRRTERGAAAAEDLRAGLQLRVDL